MSFIETKAAQAQAAKLAQWREIQLRAPDLAEFLKAVGGAFGKVALKSVAFK